MSSLGAFVETLNFIKKNNVIKKNWNYGYELKRNCNQLARDYGLDEYFNHSIAPAQVAVYLFFTFLWVGNLLCFNVFMFQKIRETIPIRILLYSLIYI